MSDASNSPTEQTTVDSPPSVPDELDQADETIAVDAAEPDDDPDAAPEVFPSPDVV